MREFDTNQLDISPKMIAAIQTMMLHLILGRCAYYGIIISAFLFALSIFVPLPFSAMWGFVIVPIGGVIGWLATKTLGKANEQ